MKIDIIIPAYKAQKTILRTLSSIATQTIIDDLEVVIVNDCCPNGDYQEFVKMFSPYFPIREIKLDKNSGPGIARQKGIDETHNPYFTCIDADDTFAGALALEGLRKAIEEPFITPNGQQIKNAFKCVSSTFLQLGEQNDRIVIPHQGGDMVWMFGKLYRRDFIEKYKIRFNDTRANEDTGFNTWVRLICDRVEEQVRAIPDITYYWHYKENSITRINNGQYQYDQCLCGWTDNMIYAIQNAKRIRPFNGTITQWSVHVMIELYYYYVECFKKQPVFADQAWEYVKKFYNTCYKSIKDSISDEAFSEMFSMDSMNKWQQGGLIGVIPHIGIQEFMNKLQEEEYNPNDIYDAWAKIPDYLKQNNIACGVCPDGYMERK